MNFGCTRIPLQITRFMTKHGSLYSSSSYCYIDFHGLSQLRPGHDELRSKRLRRVMLHVCQTFYMKFVDKMPCNWFMDGRESINYCLASWPNKRVNRCSCRHSSPTAWGPVYITRSRDCRRPVQLIITVSPCNADRLSVLTANVPRHQPQSLSPGRSSVTSSASSLTRGRAQKACDAGSLSNLQTTVVAKKQTLCRNSAHWVRFLLATGYF